VGLANIFSSLYIIQSLLGNIFIIINYKQVSSLY